MTQLLDAAWLLTKLLSYGGLLAALAGVGIFGWYFVRLNAVAAHGDGNKVPANSWRGAGAKRGMTWLVAGAGMVVLSIILAAVLPGRP